MSRTEGGSVGDDNRGVSEVLGTALLIGFVITAAVMLLVMGGNTVDQVEEQNRLQTASQSFQQFASEIESIRQSESESIEFELPEEISSDVQTESRTEVMLYANGNSSCTTGMVEMQSLVYQSNGDDAVGYEFGGVWKQMGADSSTMVRKPNIEYRDGRLAVSLSQMDTGVQGSRTINARLNESESKRLTANLTRSLFVNKTAMELVEGPSTPVGQLDNCRPQDIENITVVVENSRFATAWQNFALRNYDDRLVNVTPGDGSMAKSGDRVEIRFKVRDTSFGTFEVTNADAVPSAPAGEDVPVNVTVENTGDLTETSDVSFSLYNKTGSGWDPVSSAEDSVEDVTLNGGQEWDHEFMISGGDVDTPGTYRYSIKTDDDVRNGTIVIGNATDNWPDFQITSLDAPDNARLGSDARLNATIRNDGDLGGNQTITFSFNGSQEATRPISLGGGNETTLNFEIPTYTSGTDLPLRVNSSDDSNTTDIDIGSTAYFEISKTDVPASVNESESFNVNASITNIGDVDDTQSVEIEVENASNTSESLTLAGNLSTSGDTGASDTVTLPISGISEDGVFNYTVRTADEERTGVFYVGDKPAASFLVSNLRADPNPVVQGNTTTITAQINNTATGVGTREVSFAFDGVQTNTTNVTLGPGHSELVTFDYETASNLPGGPYDYTVSAGNSSATSQLTVEFSPGDKINLTGNTTARLQVLGTEPTGYSTRYGDDVIRRAPTVMKIVTENETAGRVTHDVWSGDDLNRPENWDRQVNRDPYLNRSITVSEASSLWVAATTYGCSYYGYETVGHRYVDSYGWADRQRCNAWDGTLVSTNSNQNTENVQILKDGQTVPSWGAASPDQRSIGDILDDKFDPSTGKLNLDDNQLVLLFELTQENADPDDATPPGTTGDPDYNDAVVLFEVVERSAETPAQLEITDTDAPAVVESDEQGNLSVEVTNRGDRTGSTNVTYQFSDDHSEMSSSIELDRGESKRVEFAIPPDTDYDPGRYGYDVGLTANPNQTRSGNIQIGTINGSSFIIQSFGHTYPRYVANGSDVFVNATVANIGDVTGNATVKWSVDGSSPPEKTEGVRLSSGASEEVSFEYDDTDGVKDVDITAAVDNSSQTRTLRIRDENFVIDHVRVGSETYNESDLILVTSLSNLDALIHNTANVGGAQNVTFTLTNRSTGVTKTAINNVSLDSNDAAYSRFSLGSWSNATGYYDYEIRTESGDTFSGTILIVPSAEEYPEAQNPEYISIDMNVITFG